eukprot:TRINITY_DN14726_c0_g1_i1.p1 TRINITY_DN14726_c0_g1~~TRINITY_DN14726_c0_g1_i1.p1  ORF type:complete len:323 (-),score=75.50 TRINITY_DN14726_c0_g1_i1:165-1133(-)
MMGKTESRMLEETKRSREEEIKRQKRKALANKLKSPKADLYLGYLPPNENTFYLYNVSKKTSSIVNLRNIKQFGCDDFIIGSLYFLIGGHKHPKKTINVDIENKFEIKSRANMNVGRYYLDSNSADNMHIYVMGGRNIQHCFSSCERYSISKNKWTLIKPMNVPRDCSSSGVMDCRYIYVVEGRNDTGFVRSIERLDTLDEDAGWELFHVYPNSFPREAKGGCWCVQISASQLLIAGGTRMFDGRDVDDVWTFDTKTLELKLYGERLPVAAELYTPAVLHKGWYYQLKYCNRAANYDLIQFSVVSGKFRVKKFEKVWRKNTL